MCYMGSTPGKNQEKTDSVPTFIEVLSPERFATYQQWTQGNDGLARRLYTYNVQLSAALYGPLHMLEIALRNVTDGTLTAAYGDAWLHDPTVVRTYGQQQRVAAAQGKLTKQHKPATHPQMVAELSFGFWTALYSRQYHHLWATLRPVFQVKGLQRQALAVDLDDLRNLRNRIAHYEPVVALPLAQLYGNLTTITGWLAPAAAAWIAGASTWPTLYPGVPLLTPNPHGGLMLEPQAIPFLPQ